MLRDIVPVTSCVAGIVRNIDKVPCPGCNALFGHHNLSIGNQVIIRNIQCIVFTRCCCQNLAQGIIDNRQTIGNIHGRHACHITRCIKVHFLVFFYIIVAKSGSRIILGVRKEFRFIAI